jgi:acyl-CoA dehydrogenase
LNLDELTDEQRDFRESVRGFLAGLLPPERVAQIEEVGEVPHDVWKAFAGQDLLGVGVSPEDGGSGGGAVELAVLVFELASISLSVSMRFLASAYSGVHTLLGHGSPAQKEELLGPYFDGDLEFGFAFTEASGGADLRGWRTSAERSGGGWKLDGSKMFTSNADNADRLLVLARTAEGDRPHQGFTLFLVPPETPGITIRRIPTMGLKAEGAFEVGFDQVPVAADAVVGEEGRGFYAALSSLDMERILVAAAVTGNAAAALAEATGYALEREAFGRPIGALQAVQHQLADSACDVEVGWQMTMKAARKFDREGACPLEATMAKYVASERAFQVAHRGMRILGGYGFTTEFAMERRFRDSQIFLTGPISSEMSRNFIGESLGLPKSY